MNDGMITLGFDRGSVVVKGDLRVPNTTWDSRAGCFRGLALYYRDIVDYLKRSGIVHYDRVLDPLPMPYLREPEFELRDYQEEALEAWSKAGRRGTIVLPTGSGKTVVAIKAIAAVRETTIIVVPTLDLLEQWKQRLESELGIDVGVLGGGSQDIKALTVSTYDSAYLRAEALGNKFAFIVFDEVHHLPAPGYTSIAEMFAAPYRMGLTATYEREDGMHKELPRLVGGKVYERMAVELAGKHLAHYDLKMIPTRLTLQEKEEYDRNHKVYLDYLRANKLSLRTPQDFQRFIMRTGRDPRARRALLARNRARNTAMNSESKMEALKDILERHAGDRTLIFTEHNELVHRISRDFLVPSITYKTPKDERQHNLECFRTGAYSTIVTSKVLDEGIDVPEASVGVILSG
ncbi:MAG: DEAD/DEAH box helicase family protein, partial [Candidatus Hydrothermarchaeaceae archaeon]